MPYLDKEEKFYDYHTGDVDGSDIFDIHKASNSDAQQILDGSKYWREEKNTYSEIIEMTPMEYYETCAKDCFNKPVENIIKGRRADNNILEHLKQVIQKYHKKFPIPYIDYANHSNPEQEGLHRMMVAGDLFGWDTKFPVQIIKWVDEERAQREKEFKHIRKIERYLEIAVEKALRYNYYNIEELEYQLKDEFEDQVRYLDEFENRDFKLELLPLEDKMMEVIIDDKYKVDFEMDKIKFLEPTEDELEDIEFDDLDDWLKSYIGESVSLNEVHVIPREYLMSRELNQELKDAFGDRYFEQPLCKEVCEYISARCSKCRMLKFAIGVWKDTGSDLELISNKGHCVIELDNKIYDFTSDQYNHYGISKKKSQPRVLDYDEDLSKVFDCPVYRDNDYLISTY